MSQTKQIARTVLLNYRREQRALKAEDRNCMNTNSLRLVAAVKKLQEEIGSIYKETPQMAATQDFMFQVNHSLNCFSETVVVIRGKVIVQHFGTLFDSEIDRALAK